MEYRRPGTLAEALSLRAELGSGAKLLAGGQSLLAMMRQGLIDPDAVISLSGIDSLKTIEIDPDGSLRIGGMVTHRRVAACAAVAERAPLLADTARRVASAQVRNLGTWGGNVAHGEPGADPPGSLLATDALVELTSVGGVRRVPVDRFFLDYLTTDIGDEEILTALIVPPQPAGARMAYYKHTARDDGDLAICGVAARLVLHPQSEEVVDLRIGITGASTTPVLAGEAGLYARGRRVSRDVAATIGRLAAAQCDPLDDAEASAAYRLAVVERLVARVVYQLAAG